MFTGIIEEIGEIKSVKGTNQAVILEIYAKNILQDVKIGDSIAVNGVCLTVTDFESNYFSVDVMPETMAATTFGTLKTGSKVNLERAMAVGDRFGGHIVSGHVDGVGTIVKKERKENAVYYQIKAPKDLLYYMILKGSVAVDGTSLTIFGLTEQTFTISIIPHTYSETIIGEKEIGDKVNIECDLIGKYLEKFARKEAPTGITVDFLQKHGFYSE
ncbi:riboflavin synthase [Aeribacillus sp. FSL K6-1305]|uniref:riboflavin synthase n=1 Tax=Aeribacillus sp. FSL K6-1305 TaxID=2954569 RepID=UPI0030FDF6B6